MTIQQICELSEEVRTGELLEAVFIDQAIKDPGSKEADAGSFLRITYPTTPLRGLIEFMAQKLSEEHPKGAVVMRRDNGSGKSHALLALYHWASLGLEAQSLIGKWNVRGGEVCHFWSVWCGRRDQNASRVSRRDLGIRAGQCGGNS